LPEPFSVLRFGKTGHVTELVDARKQKPTGLVYQNKISGFTRFSQ